MVTSTELLKPTPRFQRAIHVRYDLRDPIAISQYIPTSSAADALESILRNTSTQGTQRAHVLHAAYGSGKSHFAVTLAALLENNSELATEVSQFLRYLDDTHANAAYLAHRYVRKERRLFPVVLSGNEGDFAEGMLRALSRSLQEAELAILPIQTRFDAALQTLQRWTHDYPEFLDRFQALLFRQSSTSYEQFAHQLKQHESAAYDVFCTLYAELTAGARFDPFVEQTPEVIYRDIAVQLHQVGYDGIVVIWDEFGRYLEGHASQAFGSEAASLQNFAEACNYSGNPQLHLLLFTHKELQGYAAALPQSYHQEWARIEGRFQRHDLSTDPLIAYRLIGAAIQHTDPDFAHQQLPRNDVESLGRVVRNYGLFTGLSESGIENLVYDTWPLHPLAVFALAQLSNRVAQNERTMFTFLTSTESDALVDLVRAKVAANGERVPLIRVHHLWDYFENAIRADIGGAGAHRHWSGVINALDKASQDDLLAQDLIKALGVLSICADNSPIRPTDELLYWAVGAESEHDHRAVDHVLDNLRRRKVIIKRQIDGYWTFILGSDINFEELVQQTLETVNPTLAQLRHVLEKAIPAPHALARRYNQKHAMIRYFSGVYRWAEELANAPWDLLMEQMAADGLVVYALIDDGLAWEQAFESLQAFDRVVYVFPKQDQPLSALKGLLREVMALQMLNDDPNLRQNGDERRIQRELDWLMEDALGRLEILMDKLVDPRQGQADWIVIRNGMAQGYSVSAPGQAARIVSDICFEVFPKTPILNSEGLNKQHPSAQQIRAAELVVDAMFSNQPDETLGLEGRGPEILALNALLSLTGILRKDSQGEYCIGRPLEEDSITEVWDLIGDFLSQSEGRRNPAAPLIEKLTAPPYGLRHGVIPVLLAAVMRNRVMVISLWKGRQTIGTIDGHVLTELVFAPDDYTIEVGQWTVAHEHLWSVLESRFAEYIQELDQTRQPLVRVRTAMTRWLQGLPSFCRFTMQLSRKAIQFRDIIRRAQMEPAKALFVQLPAVLELNEDTGIDEAGYRVDQIMQEISNAYFDLQRRLDVFVAREFGYAGQNQYGVITLKTWLSGMQPNDDTSIGEFKFSSTLAQNLVNAILESSEEDGLFWSRISEAVLGVALRDWNDSSEERFCERLLEARDEIDRDVHELIEQDKAITFSIQMPTDDTIQDFRFRSSELTPHGQRLLQNFKSTMSIAGRPLTADEKRKIALAFLLHVMGENLDD